MVAALFLAIALSPAQTPAAQAPTAQAAAAAAIAAAPGPAECVTALQAFVPKRQQEVRTPTGFTSELLRQVNDEKLALAKSCLARFDPATVKTSQLPGLSELFTAAGQPEEGRGKVTDLPGPDPNETGYKVSGIPQIQLIDKHGKIRLIMIGYDDANEAGLATFIAKLMAEK